MSSVKQSNALLGNAPTNFAQSQIPPTYLTLKEVAGLLKVKPRIVYAWLSDNRSPFERKGNLLRFRLDAVVALNEPAVKAHKIRMTSSANHGSVPESHCSCRRDMDQSQRKIVPIQAKETELPLRVKKPAWAPLYLFRGILKHFEVFAMNTNRGSTAEAQPKFLNVKEVAELLRIKTRTIYEMVYTIRGFTLSRSATSFSVRLIHVMNSRRERTKSGRSRSVPLTSIAREELLALHKESGWSEYVFVNSKTFQPLTDVKKAFTSALRKAGIEDSISTICATLARRGLVIAEPALSRSLKSWDGQTFASRCATRMQQETVFAARYSY